MGIVRLQDRLFRHEEWGSIVYDPVRDEFEAHVNNSADEISSERPISAGCLITGKCDLLCPHCYGNAEGLPPDTLNASDWSRVFSKLRQFGLMRVDISGGEPTSRPDMESILNHALNTGLNVVLSTNGRRLGQRGLASIPNSVRIHVSIDSGDPAIHEANRRLHSGKPSSNSFENVSTFLRTCVDSGYRVRVLTAVGGHNKSDLLRLGEHLAMLGVSEWNISRVLPAGRALLEYAQKWAIPEEEIADQVDMLQKAIPWMTIRYSNRTAQNGYFLLVLPDGSIATQFTDAKDKVILGQWDTMESTDFLNNSNFVMREHFSKWIARVLYDQPPEWVQLERELSLIA